MTASELQTFRARSLSRSIGGRQRRWRVVVGPVGLHPLTRSHRTWSVDPSNIAREVIKVEELFDRLRLHHPVASTR